MADSALVNLSVSGTEAFSASILPSASKRNITHDAFNEQHSLNSTSTPPVSKVAANTYALTAGAVTLDFTALASGGGQTKSMSGLKLNAVKFVNPSTNTNPIVIVPGASNGYNMAGAASKITLQPSEEAAFKFADTLPDVDGTHKTLDITDGGAGGTESFEAIFCFG